MSNLHKDLDEANLHAPKGFTLVGNNTRPWKNELGQAVYTENNELPRAINFVDGTAAAPSSVDGDIFVIIGSGVLDGSWGTTAAFGDWVRAENSIFTPITPVKGMLCYDDTASSWLEFDGTVWAVFGGGGVGTTNLSEGTSTTTTVDVDSDTGTNATLQPASTIRAGVMSKAKFDEVVANNGKVSADGSINTHSDVDTTTSVPSIGEALIWDGSNWVPDTPGGADTNLANTNLTFNASRTHDLLAFGLTFDGGNVTIKGKDGLATSLGFLVKDIGNNDLFAVDNFGDTHSYYNTFTEGKAWFKGAVEQTGTSVLHKVTSTASNGVSEIGLYNNDGVKGQITSTGSSYGGSGGALYIDAFAIRSTATAQRFVLAAGVGDIYFVNGGSLVDSATHMKSTPSGVIIGSGIGAVPASARAHVRGSASTGTGKVLLATNLNGTYYMDFLNDGTANISCSKFGMFGAPPIAQPTTAITAAAFVANTSGIADDTATYGGYTGGQMAAALISLGALT